MFVVARRHSRVARTDAATEWMKAHVKSARLKIKSNRRCRFQPELLLRGYWIAALENFHRRFAPGAGDLFHQLHQRPSQARESLPYALGRLSRFKFIQQRIIRILLETHAFGLAFLQLQRLLKPRQKQLEIGLLLRLSPRLLRHYRSAAQFLDQRTGKFPS